MHRCTFLCFSSDLFICQVYFSSRTALFKQPRFSPSQYCKNAGERECESNWDTPVLLLTWGLLEMAPCVLKCTTFDWTSMLPGKNK